MTLPALIQQHQKKEITVALEKMYTTLMQAANTYQALNEVYITDFDTSLSAKDFMETYFNPFLNISMVCKDDTDCWYGKRPNGYSPPFIVMFENWDYLLAMHYRVGEQFSWSIMPPYDGSAMSLYISCKEEEGFSREYIDELLDWKILTDRLDVHTWIVSE